MVHDGHLEKHIGCMAGFLQIFDPIPGRQRHRPRSSPRLLPSGGGSACSSPAVSEEIPSGKVSEVRSPAKEAEDDTVSVRSTPKTPTAAFPAFEFKDGGRLPWKFSKEAPRLSLDSRAVTDVRGGLYPRDIRTASRAEGLEDKGVGGGGDEDTQRRSPSVIARLMGLENLPSSDPNNPRRKMELRRSASDSRAHKEIYRFIEGGNYGNGSDYPRQGSMASVAPAARLPTKESSVITRANVRREQEILVAVQPQKGSVQRKSHYDTTDFFPEHNRSAHNGSLHEEIGKKLRARGIDEPSKDLDSLKQILEAMQLKGLLHCKAGHGIRSLQNQRKGFDADGSPIVLMRPRSFWGRSWNESQPPSRSPIRGRVNSALDCSRANTPTGRRQPEDRKSPSREQARTPRAQSPRPIVPRKAIQDHTVTHRAHQGGNFAEEKVIVAIPPTAEDEASTVSESSVSTPSSQTNTEKSKLREGYKEGRTLLERCDKLLNNIAEITAASAAAAAELQPSPVSVLDRSLLYDEELEGPRQMTKRGPLHFKDCSAESADDDALSPVPTDTEDDDDDREFLYVSDVVGVPGYLQGDPALFQLLEKRWYLRGKDASTPLSRLHRKLTFDAVTEILDRRRNLLWWKHAPWTVFEQEKADLGQIWSVYEEIRRKEPFSPQEDVLGSVRGLLGRDLKGNPADEWARRPVETTESAVDIERLIFKDLIGETIRDLGVADGDGSGKSSKSGHRRKLAF
ncbi:hypothetical protein MLD38_028081 [Melastoma candidum]|uniref:Uncharacterized protein n=1 Tax=Melastoma candidum TaxID=119954 RepID=A0ACB9N0T8_9MYRT|nr:hypothetical protein MLD38_028081 [Melastoma candidum]